MRRLIASIEFMRRLIASIEFMRRLIASLKFLSYKGVESFPDYVAHHIVDGHLVEKVNGE